MCRHSRITGRVPSPAVALRTDLSRPGAVCRDHKHPAPVRALRSSRSRSPARLNAAVPVTGGLHVALACESLHIETLALQVLRRIPWGGRADASGRVALHATAFADTTCLVFLPPGRSLLPNAKEHVDRKSRVGCRAVSRLPLLAGGSPHDSQRKAVSLVSTVRSHLGCQSLARAHRSKARRHRARVPGDASPALVMVPVRSSTPPSMLVRHETCSVSSSGLFGRLLSSLGTP
jgi:hypothetical protein